MVLFSVFLAVTVVSQAPQIQNARVETRQATSLDRDVAAAGAGLAEPIWVGWRVPLAVGATGDCSTSNNASYFIRGEYLESRPFSSMTAPQAAAPSGPVQLEAASELVILLRVVGPQVERMRPLSGDCPLDAGGRTVVWLQGVTPANSLSYLEGFLRPNMSMTPDQEQRLSESAISAIALHRDAGADAILDRLANGPMNNNLRRQARSALGSTRGAHGFDALRQLLEAERAPEIRRQLISALGQTRQPGTADALLQIARRDTDPRARAEATYWVPQRGGQRVVADVRAIIASDSSDEVRQRAVKGLARLPADESIPLLIDLARTDKSPVVRKEAVSALSSSRDQRALAYLETLVK